MASAPIGSLAATLALVAVLLLLGRRRTRPLADPKWLSFASGIAVAYVFVDLLPHLAEHNARWKEARPEPLVSWLSQQVYLAALAGLLIMYGVEQLSARRPHRSRPFYVHLAIFCIYNLAVGFFLTQIEQPLALMLSFVAFAAHFAINGNTLRREDPARSDRIARPMLAASVLGGWALGTFVEVPLLVRATTFAFLAGVIILTALSEELPEARKGGFARFAFAAATFTLLLLGESYAEHGGH